MRKASATVIYKAEPRMLPDNTSITIYNIYNLTINYKNNNITLIQYNADTNKTTPAPYDYNNFYGMYETVLNIAKNNGFYFGSYEEFGLDWFDVQWISTEDPWNIRKYGYNKGVRV